MSQKKKIGSHLKKRRKALKIKPSQTGLRFEIMQNIENGSSNYTIDSLMTYMSAIGETIYFKTES